MLIPIKQNVEDRTDTWKGYIRVEKAERHYFLIDGDSDEIKAKEYKY